MVCPRHHSCTPTIPSPSTNHCLPSCRPLRHYCQPNRVAPNDDTQAALRRIGDAVAGGGAVAAADGDDACCCRAWSCVLWASDTPTAAAVDDDVDGVGTGVIAAADGDGDDGHHHRHHLRCVTLADGAASDS